MSVIINQDIPAIIKQFYCEEFSYIVFRHSPLIPRDPNIVDFELKEKNRRLIEMGLNRPMERKII